MLVAQTSKISGQVVDAKTSGPLPFANVFINNTTIGTATDENGFFKLNVPIGRNEVIFSFVGYQSHQTRVDLTDQQQLEITVRLAPDDKMLENVQVEGKRDKVWESQLKRFTRVFLGTGKEVAQCKIINPWVLEFTEDRKVLFANASEDLIIENETLGYKIFYALKKFMANGGEYAILGTVRFEEMKTPDATVGAKWVRNRLNAYRGSQRHLIKAILNQKVRAEGFLLYNDKSGFENSPRSSVFFRELGYSIEEFDSTQIHILPDDTIQGSKIELKKRIEVHFTRGSSRIRSYDDVSDPVSWLDLKNGSIVVNTSGAVLDPENMVTSGYMSSLRVADLLPNDYEPGQVIETSPLQRVVSAGQQQLLSLYEKVYVHTDKPYYYPGERIWFKAYLNYYFQSVRDSLSTTLYVELIDPAKRVIMEKILALDSGFVSNDFILPDSIGEGTYYLRAYTQLQRNFGDENLFVKQLPVLKLTSKPAYANEKEEQQSPGLTVTPDKISYTRREKVTITIELKDQEDNPISGNFSVSVTDAAQVMKIPESGTILEKFPIKKEEIGQADKIKYLAEYGISMSGQFLNNKGKGEKTLLNIVQFEPYQLAFVDTDEHGYFQYWGLQFYDERSFSFNSTKGKERGKQYGQVKLLKREAPSVNIKDSEFKIQIINAQSVQRTFSEYEKPFDSKMLEAVEVKSTRINEDFVKNVSTINRPYGAGDYVFDESKIKTQFPNLLYTLQALNISGLVVNPNEATIYFARAAKPKLYNTMSPLDDQIAKTYTPMVTLDGMPVVGSAGEALSIIDPNTVASIEVTKKPSSIRGSLAPYGVIAVFTKSSLASVKKDQSSLSVVKVQGYSIPNKFNAPNYQSSNILKTVVDFRSTLYWNPSIKTGPSGTSQFSFYTSDLVGSYRVVLEGVTGNGEAVRSVGFLEVRE